MESSPGTGIVSSEWPFTYGSPANCYQKSRAIPRRIADQWDSERGKTANLVLLTANPLEDIRNTQKIDSVVLNGTLLMRGDLDNLLAHVATRAAASNAGTPSS
jgi:hypothetical protein